MSDIHQVEIRYRRPPDRLEHIRQPLIHDGPDGKVTFLERASVRRTIEIDGVTILEPGAPIVWFTFPGAWHDIGRFHRSDGTFTGIYANVLTPVEGIEGPVWDTTDLFLDVWLDGRGARVLDEDEMEDAIGRGWLDPATAARARVEASRLTTAAAAGHWPPPIVAEWPLARVLERLDG